MYLPFTLPALLISQVPTRFSPFIGAGAPSVLDIPRPDPPAPNGYEHLPDSYASALEAAWDKLEAQLAAPESDWTSEGEEAGVKRWSRDNPESGLPLMKGEALIEGYEPAEISAVIESMAMRKIWDPRMDSGFMLSRFSPAKLSFYTATKPPGFLVWARDIVGASDTRGNATFVRNLATSVTDDRAPDQSGKVRANLHFSGWELRGTEGGTYVTSLTSIDLAGSLPNWVTRSALKETPLAVARVRDALASVGVPPRLVGTPSSVIQLTNLADDRKSWALWIRGARGDAFDVRWDRKMFPAGVDVRTEGEGWSGVEYEHDGETLHLKIGDDAHEKQVVVRLTAK